MCKKVLSIIYIIYFCLFSGYNNQDPFHRKLSLETPIVSFFLLFSIVVEFGHSVISSATPTTSVPTGCSTYYALHCAARWCPALSKSIVPQWNRTPFFVSGQRWFYGTTLTKIYIPYNPDKINHGTNQFRTQLNCTTEIFETT